MNGSVRDGASCLPMAAVILAAGAATRMGRLKQLLSYDGRTFVQHAIRVALAVQFDPVIVVVGAEAASVRASIASQRITVVENTQWRDGMGSSIAVGIEQLQREQTDVAAVAILLADQPLVEAGHLNRMRTEFHRGNASIVAAEYDGTVGVPAIFRRSLFDALRHLPPAAGARRLFSEPGLKMQPFPLPEAAFDIDTPDDLAALQARGS